LSYATSSSAAASDDEPVKGQRIVPQEFREVFPDFLPESNFERRHPIAEKLIRADMLRRRMNIDIPEFYVGSVLAVTCSDAYAPKRVNRFVGICIERDMRGLWHQFLLRNHLDGIAVEVPYDMYNPLIQSIQVLRLEKRPDEHVLYLRDALPEYSTFPFDMQVEPTPPGAPVPVNMTKVKMKAHPWSKRWQNHQMYGIQGIGIYENFNEFAKKKFHKTKFMHDKKYDIVGQYRRDTTLRDQETVYEHALDFERENQAGEKKFAGRKITTVGGVFKARQEYSAKGSAGGKENKKWR